jgi:hypothetical protein
MHPVVTRFAAAVGRRVLLWFAVMVVIGVIRHLMRAH